MTKVFCLLLFVLSFHIQAQDFSVLKGTVKDKVTGNPIAFVNVSTDDYQVMVVTNNEGKFRIVVKKGYSGSLTFEHIGYQKYVLSNVSQTTQHLDITMEASLYQLKTVHLHTPTGEEVVKKVIKNADKNYNYLPKSFEVFHRSDYTVSDWAKNTLCSQMKVEQVAHIQLPSRGEKDARIKKQVIKLRFIDNMHPIETNVISSDARFLAYLHLFDFQKIKIFKDKNVKKCNFIIDTTGVIQEGYITLQFRSKKYGKMEKETINGTMTINENDFSIASISYTIRKREKIKEENEIRYEYNNTKITLNYTNIEGVYYPTYIKSEIYQTNDFSENSEAVDGFFDKYISEIFITKQIDTQVNDTIITKADAKKSFQSFFNDNQDDDDGFFHNYNMIFPEKENNIEKNKVYDNEIENILLKASEKMQKIQKATYTLIHTYNRMNIEDILKVREDSVLITFERKKYGSYGANICINMQQGETIHINNMGLFEIDSIHKTYKYYTPSSQECLFFSRKGLIFPALPKSSVYFDNFIHAVKVCKTTFNKEKLNNEDVYAIEVRYPNSKEKGTKNFIEKLYISTRDYTPIKIAITKQVYGVLTSEEWTLKDLSLENDSIKFPQDIEQTHKKTN